MNVVATCADSADTAVSHTATQATCPALSSTLPAGPGACPRLGAFLRQAVGLAARRGLARAVNETYRTVLPVAPLLVPAVRVGSAAAQAYFLAFPALPAAVVP